MAKNISDALNAKWDPSWNVIISSISYEMVFNGYAFRNHWLWFNNYEGTGKNFIIWKDFKCHTWMDFASNANGGNIPASTLSKIGNLSTIASETSAVLTGYINDIWTLSNNFGTSLRVEPEDYSVVVFQARPFTLYGRLCVVNTEAGNQYYYKFIRAQKITDPGIGYFIFRTR